MSSELSKRPHGQDSPSSNGTAKHLKASGHHTQDQQLKFASHGTIFRILCPASRLGRFTGENGGFISKISEETGIEVRLEDISGCEERIVVIKGPKNGAKINFQRGIGDDQKEREPDGADDCKKHDNGKEGDEKSVSAVDSVSKTNASSVQKALSLVFERMAELELEANVDYLNNDEPSPFVVRLVVLSKQLEAPSVKGGSLFKQISAEKGAQIQTLPRDEYPPCVSAFEEIVQITGQVDKVRKTFQSLIRALLENPLLAGDPLSTFPAGASSQPFNRTTRKSKSKKKNQFLNSRRPSGAARVTSTEKLIFKLLCSKDRVGGIIGKGGAVIRTLQHDTGCEVNILNAADGRQGHIVVISGPAHPDDRISPVQDATLRVQARIARAIPDSHDNIVGARLLVTSNQIGCLLGKCVGVISELSGARICIGNGQVSWGASESDELVQISGEFKAVQEALLQITTRLRYHFFRDAFPSTPHPLDPAFLDMGPPFPPFIERRDFSPPGPYPMFHAPLHNRLGAPPLRDDRHPSIHDFRPGMPMRMYESDPWGPQGFIEDGGQRDLPDFSGDPSRKPGLGGGTQPPIVSNTAVEVVVPSSLVPAIHGEDGSFLAQIQQISDAKVAITEAKPGAAETEIIILGTPEQNFAAQSLIQAFVLSEMDLSS